MGNHLKYSSLDDAPPQHREIARLHTFGATYSDIGLLVGLSARQVAKVCAHPPIIQEMHAIQIRKETAIVTQLDEFSKLMPNAIGALEGVLAPKSTASNKDRLKAAEMVFDREATGRFIKTTRTEHAEVHIVDSREIEEIKQLSHSLGRPTAIEVDFEELTVNSNEEIIDWTEVIELKGHYHD